MTLWSKIKKTFSTTSTKTEPFDCDVPDEEWLRMCQEVVDDIIETADDETLLQYFIKFLSRVDIATQFINNDKGLITHQVLIGMCGEYAFNSTPEQLQHPLQMATIDLLVDSIEAKQKAVN